MANMPMFVGAYRTGETSFTNTDAVGTLKEIATAGTNGSEVSALRAAFAARSAFPIAVWRNSTVVGWIDVPTTTTVTTLNLLNGVEDGKGLKLAAGDTLSVSLGIQPDVDEVISVNVDIGDY